MISIMIRGVLTSPSYQRRGTCRGFLKVIVHSSALVWGEQPWRSLQWRRQQLIHGPWYRTSCHHVDWFIPPSLTITLLPFTCCSSPSLHSIRDNAASIIPRRHSTALWLYNVCFCMFEPQSKMTRPFANKPYIYNPNTMFVFYNFMFVFFIYCVIIGSMIT